MYHSTAILLPDSSVLVSGGNPNADFTEPGPDTWPSHTDADKWYPWYFNEPRPTLPSDAPTTLSYGGASFDVPLNTMDETAVKSAKMVIIRGGFHTHAIGFGMKYLQLNSTYSTDLNTNTSTLHVAQMPGNPGPTLFQPGPALMFLVINGVPSQGQMVMIGSGALGDQPTQANADLPASSFVALNTSTGDSGSGGSSTSQDSKGGGASAFASVSVLSVGVAVLASLALI